jgi:hypothetical protein
MISAPLKLEMSSWRKCLSPLKLEVITFRKDLLMSTTSNMRSILNNLQLHKRLSRQTDILNYWEARKMIFSEFFEQANIVLTVPRTQLVK